MVGSFSDAEDIVQDTFLKWLTVDQDKIKNNKSYLIRAVTNNSINHINSLKRKKDEYLENINSSDLVKKYIDWEAPKIDLENELSEALAVIHKKLEPLEQAIFILREVFDFDYEELQVLFDKKKDNCRQIFCRAKEKLTLKPFKFNLDISKHTRFLESFKESCKIGHPNDFIQEIKKELSLKFS